MPFYNFYSPPLSTDNEFGIEWNKTTDVITRLGAASGKTRSFFDSMIPWVGMRRCNLSDTGVINAYFGEPGYIEDGSNGQVMVEIPKFWYRTELTPIGYRWWISNTQLSGYKVHPAFVRNEVEKSKIYFSAYEGSIYDVSADAYLLVDEQVADFTVTTGDKLCSRAGVKPCSGLTQNLIIPNARILARNRGTGWEQQDFLTSSAIQLLMLVEYAVFDMQTAIGKGVVDKTSGSVNESENTGQTSGFGNVSGMAAGTNGLVSISYRGIENFWGNIWTWVDGINIKADFQPWVADNGFASDLFASPYKTLGVTLANANGYVSDIAFNYDFDFGFLATQVAGSSSTKLTDYYYQATGNRVALLGGDWSTGLYAGARCWSLGISSADRYRNVGARLLFIPQN